MAKVPKQKSSIDTVFDFIFQAQKEKVDKPIRKPHPSTGVYTSSLIEIGTQPTIYPLESAFNAINGYIARETGIGLSEGVSVGLGESILGNSNTTISKSVSKNRADANFARLGGSLHSGIDGALVSLYSKSNGGSSKTAYASGVLFADLQRQKLKKSKRDSHLFGYRTSQDEAREDVSFQRRGTDLMVSTLAKMDPRLDKNFILNAVREGQNIDSQNERIRDLDAKLKLQGFNDPKERYKIAQYVWGKDQDDLGLYKKNPESTRNKLDRVVYGGGKALKAGVKNRGKLEGEIAKALALKDPKKRKEEAYKILRNGYQINGKLANSMAEELVSEEQVNSGEDIARNALYTSLVSDIQGKAMAEGDYVTVANAREAVKGVLENERSTLATQVARAQLAYSWIKNSGAWGDILLNGNWEKFGVGEDLNFTNIVEKKNVMDKGEVIGSYFVPANSVMGKLMGSAYYLHPNNFIRGAFLDGSLWLKLADKGGKLNKKSFAYLLYEMRLGKFASTLAKPFKVLSQKIYGMINPLAEGVKKFVKNLLTKIIGASGLAGFLVNKLMDIFGDKIQQIVSQLVNVLLLGILAILFVLLESTGVLYSDDKVAGLSSSPNMVETEDLNVFTNEDFPVKE